MKIYSYRLLGGKQVEGDLIKIDGDIVTVKIDGKEEQHIIETFYVSLIDYEKLRKENEDLKRQVQHEQANVDLEKRFNTQYRKRIQELEAHNEVDLSTFYVTMKPKSEFKVTIQKIEENEQ